ncbi:MAG: NHL repeat-containing protein, partial [Chloroflexota bacterium]|nr:NHL repeat-containing protein [Chloroflexota bacterium]
MPSTIPNSTYSGLANSMVFRTSTIGLIVAVVASAFLLVAMPTHAQTGDISTVAGGGVGDGGRPTLAALTSPDGVAVDSRGDVYVADGAAHRIRKIDIENNIITTFAGTGNPGFSGDGGPATAAELNSPFGLAFDDADNLYIADSGNHRIRRIDLATGIITTLAGSGSPAFEGDDGSALDAAFHAPHGVDVDRHGNIYIADTLNNRIRKVDAFNGIVTTIAGTGIAGSAGDLGLAVNAELNQPNDVAVDDLGKVYIADTGSHIIRHIDVQGVIITLAGQRNVPVNSVTVANSGPALNAVLRNPLSLTLDQEQRNLYVADTGNHLVRRILLNNVIEDTLITTEAGSVDGSAGYDGEDRNAIVSSLDSPSAVAVNSLGQVYIADTGNQRVRAVVSPGERRPKILVTVAGNGESSFSGERTSATNATLHFPSDVALDPDGNVYFSDTGNHRVRRVDLSTGLIRTVAGNGVAGSLGVG